MNIRKVVAVVLVGTMTMAGTAFAGTRFNNMHQGRGGFEHKRLEQHHIGNHGGRIWGRGQQRGPKSSWSPQSRGWKGKNQIFTPGGHGRGPKVGVHGWNKPRTPKTSKIMKGGRVPRSYGSMRMRKGWR